jgi:DNA-binding transcriptional LysR family regulator
MQLIDLETLVLAVQESSLSAAARRLFVSQPAVSARIRRLETAAGEPLLRRSGRGVRPTAAGAYLHERALPLLEQLRRLDQEIGERGEVRGRLALGATDLVAVHRLPAVIRKLRRRRPHLELAVRVEGTAALLRLLGEGEVEMVLATLPVSDERFESVALYRDPLVIVADPRHRLAARRKIVPPDLAAETWILHKPESITRQLVEGFFAGHGVALRVGMEISSPEAIKELVHARLGLGVLPACSVKRDLTAGRLASLGVRGFDLIRSTGLIVRRATPLSRAAGALRHQLVGTD